MESGWLSVASIIARDYTPRQGLEGARICVAGLGTSGRAAVDVLSTLGMQVCGIDRSEAAVQGALEAGLAAVQHCATDEDFAAEACTSDLIVVSPGIAPSSLLYQRAAAAGIAMMSEIELAWQLQAPHHDGGYAPWLSLTGTNGKTTTTTMTAAILQAAGAVAPAIGNVGTPAVLIAARGGVDALAVEVSSFQLHSTHSVHSWASACLNFDADHLDWHGGEVGYWQDKARVHHGTQTACLYSRTSLETRRMVEEADVTEGARAISIGTDVPPVAGLGIVDDLLIDRAFIPTRHTEGEVLAQVSDLEHLAPLEGQLPDHILIDALFAAGLARAAGVAPQAVAAGLRAYQPGAHRIQTVAELEGVRFINDSKATNAHAARACLLAQRPHSVVWIAGGLAKGARFDELVSQVRDRLQAVVLIGADPEPLTAALAAQAPEVPVHRIDPAEESVMRAAVEQARAVANRGNVVVLAPACASMDQFPNYAVRGDEFAAAVRGLKVAHGA